MTKNMKNNWHKNGLRPTRTRKHYIAALGVMLAVTVIVAVFSSTSASIFSVQTINSAGPETQFELSIAYAYVEEGPSNASYTATNGKLMSPVSQYPSAILFNSTRLLGTQIPSCDAEIEVYKVQIATETGVAENHCYFIGTNYNPSFSSSELSLLFDHVSDLSVLSGSMAVRGDFRFNWTQNTSFLSRPIGSVGCYCYSSNSGILGSSVGLWRAGKPNVISITVHRIGYLTMSHGSVFLYKDPLNNSATTMEQLNEYGNGFLYNNLVPVVKMPQTDLFNPAP